MNLKVTVTAVPVFLLAASLLQGATPPQARLTLVEQDAASGALASAHPSVIHKQEPGLPDRVAYRFSQPVHVGSPVTENVAIVFNEPTTLKSIEATNDFHVASSSCRLAMTYAAGATCEVAVTLDPRGPGKRAGLLTFSSNESATPDVVGLQGQTLGAVISFIPAQINTLPQSTPNGKPMFDVPWDLVVDQGDNLYVSDIYQGTNFSNGGSVWFLDSSGVFTEILGGGSELAVGGTSIPSEHIALQSPAGIAVDSFLDLYTADRTAELIDESSRGWTIGLVGQGTGNSSACTAGAPCKPNSVALDNPNWVNVDNNDNLYFTASGFYSLPYQYTAPRTLSLVSSANVVNLSNGVPFGLDSYDNFYARDGSTCQIDGAVPSSGFEWDAAGSGPCGYSGNNIRSQGAELQGSIGGYAFDAAGDMYFSDTINNVIRRVDSYNGLIRTVAGNFALGAGDTGDGGPATAATLDNPAGVAVDSTGLIYTTSANPAFNAYPYEVVRTIGVMGQTNFPVTLVGKQSPVETSLLTNTGNDELMVSNQIMGGANPGDFVPDPATTSCTWGAGLQSGRSCQLGFTCKPTAAGLRTATVTFVDNTATFQNTLNLACYAIASQVTPFVTITTPAAGAQYIAGSNPVGNVTVANNITAVVAPPTGTVTLTVVNTATAAVVATFGLNSLNPVAGVSKSVINPVNLGALPVGNYSLQAAYSGDTIDAPANATPVAFSIVQVTPTVTITSPVFDSKSIPGYFTVTGAVSNAKSMPASPMSPTGDVTITLVNTTTMAKTTITTNLTQGTADGPSGFNASLGLLLPAVYNLSVAYGGDARDKAANSSTDVFVVTQITPTVVIFEPSPTIYTYGTKLQYEATVSNAGLTPADPSSPTGTVTFTVLNETTNSTTVYGPFTLVTGAGGVSTATDPIVILDPVASYSITAAYSGDTADTTASATTLFHIAPATPVISWPTPTFVYTGTKLSSTQLDAKASYLGVTVPGTFVYSPPAGTVESVAGNVTLKVTFEPTDTVDFNNATGSTQLLVLNQITAAPIVKLASLKNPAASAEGVELNAVVTAASGKATPTGSVSLSESGKILASATLLGGQAKLIVSKLAAGKHTLVATYSGDEHNGASTSEPLTQVVVVSGFNPVSPIE